MLQTNAVIDACFILGGYSDICRLSECAVQNCISSARIAYESVVSASNAELVSLSDEWAMLHGAAPSDADRALELGHFNSLLDSAHVGVGRRAATGGGVVLNFGGFGSTDSSSSSSQRFLLHREDLWLSIQRYRQCVRDSQEALCVLIAASMDLELLQQVGLLYD